MQIKRFNKQTRIELECGHNELLTPKQIIELATKLLERYVEVMKI